jgi:rare lipoprotein A
MNGEGRAAEREGRLGARSWAGETALLALVGLSLAACAGGPGPAPVAGTEGRPSPRYSGYKVGQPYQVRGVWYTPREQPNYDEVGIASWYGEAFHNRYTADGEVFDMTLPSAAHTTLPLPSLVEVTNLANGKTLIVRVNDRGPFVDGRVIDLSKAAAAELGFVTAGITRVRVRYVGRAPDAGGMSARQQIAEARRPAVPTPAVPAPAVPAPAAAAPVPRAAEYAYESAPSRPIPYGQLARAVAAPAAAAASVPMSIAAYTAKAAVRAPSAVAAAPAALASAPVPMAPAPVAAPVAAPGAAPLPDVDRLLAFNNTTEPGVPAAVRASYDLQAGTFATEDSARRFASGLTGGGLPEVQAVHDGGGVSYQVVVHGLAGPTEAAAARNEAIALGATRAQIVGGS